MKKDKLPEAKGCPFCGGRPKINKDGPFPPEVLNVFFAISCRCQNRCSVWPTAYGDTKEEALAKWNRRAEVC